MQDVEGCEDTLSAKNVNGTGPYKLVSREGWDAAMDASTVTDIEGARVLMAEAGYGDGFTVMLNCPNDLYNNDEAICQAAVGMYARIGVTANLDAQHKAQHFPLVNILATGFYMLGWGVPTYDSEYIFNFLVHSRDDKYGSWNATRFSDPVLNAKIQGLASNTDVP